MVKKNLFLLVHQVYLTNIVIIIIYKMNSMEIESFDNISLV